MPTSSQAAAPAADVPAVACTVHEVERLAAPSPEEFLRRHVRGRRPVILTGMTRGWAPPGAWTFARMAERYGSARVVAAGLSGGTIVDDERRGVVFRRIELRAFVDSLSRPGAATDYVMAPTWNLPPSFAEDYQVPAYCAGARHLRAKVWLGKAGTVTPIHRDVPHNLHVHLTGRKRWLLFSPSASSHLYPRGLFSGMPNFAGVDPERRDDTRWPRFRDATALGATLEPGETLFIPQGWWHHTRCLDDAISMNFWWGGRLVALAAHASTVFKRLRGIVENEWAA